MSNPTMIALKCPVCSAPMRMTSDIEAACEHCGVTTLLPSVREGADVRRIAEASAGTTAAANRIAAELALPRLHGDLAALEYNVAVASGASAMGGFLKVVAVFLLVGFVGTCLVGLVTMHVGAFIGVGVFTFLAIMGAASGWYAVIVKPKEDERFEYIQWARNEIAHVQRRIYEARTVIGR